MTGVQTCALPICEGRRGVRGRPGVGVGVGFIHNDEPRLDGRGRREGTGRRSVAVEVAEERMETEEEATRRTARLRVTSDSKTTIKLSKIKPTGTRDFNVENPSNKEEKNHGRQPAILHYFG